jgi:hypothetical protein
MLAELFPLTPRSLRFGMVQLRFEETQEISFRKSGEKRTGVNLDYCDISTTFDSINPAYT